MRPVINQEMLLRLGEIFSLFDGTMGVQALGNGEASGSCCFNIIGGVELSKLVNKLKTVTSSRLRQEFPEHIKKFLWKDIWRMALLFVASCGGVTNNTLKQYIEGQDKPEA